MAKVTLTTKVAKEVCCDFNLTSNFLWNDARTNGRRSLKVYGWKDFHYTECKKRLEKLGCIVEVSTRLVTQHLYGEPAFLQTRLIVKEPAVA